MLCSSSAFRCFTVFKSPKFEGLLDRNVLRGEKREGVLSCFVADIEDELKLSVADRGCGAVYFVVSSNDASLAAAENALRWHKGVGRGGGYKEESKWLFT